VPTGYSKVTVVNGTRRVDLALPTALPVADVVPQLLRFCSPDELPERPAAWTLGRLGGPNINLGHSLADAGVLDGELLELRSIESAAEPAYVEDVRDAVEDVVDDAGGQWGSRTTRGFVLGLAAIGAAAVALLPSARAPHDAGTVAAAVLLALVGVAGGWWGADRTHPAAAQAAIATGCLWGAVAGWLAGMSADLTPWPAIALGAAAALAIAVAARVATPLATPHLAALAVSTGAIVVAAVVANWDPTAVARVLGVLAVLAVGALPRAAVSAGGLAAADYQVRKAALMTRQELAERVRLGTGLLMGAIVATAAVGALAGVRLAYAEPVWDRLLALAIGVGLLLRSRVFSRIRHMVPLRLAGAVVLAAHAVRIASLDGIRPWFVVLVAVSAAAVVALSAVPLSDIGRARVKRILNWTESIVVIAMIALCAAGLGLYAMVSDLAS